MLRRLEASRDLRASIEAFRDDDAAGFRRQLAGELSEGETMPDQGLSLKLVARWVTTACRRLKEKEHDYCQRGIERVALVERGPKAGAGGCRQASAPRCRPFPAG